MVTSHALPIDCRRTQRATSLSTADRGPLSSSSQSQWHQQFLVLVPFTAFFAVATMAPTVPCIGAGRSGDPTETAAVSTTTTVCDALMNYSSNIMIMHNTVRHGMLFTCAELKLKNELIYIILVIVYCIGKDAIVVVVIDTITVRYYIAVALCRGWAINCQDFNLTQSKSQLF